jgi:hypothetical protein
LTGFLRDPDLTEKFLAQSESYLKAAKEADVSGEALGKEVEAGLERIKKIEGELGDLRGVGLPIGYDYFPGCAFTGYSGKTPVPAGVVVARTVFKDPAGKSDPKLFRWQLVKDDPACYETLRTIETRKWEDLGKKSPLVCRKTETKDDGTPGDTDFAACAQAFAEKYQPNPLAVIMASLDSGAAYKWAALVVVAGLLVGLGAPFWFDFFTSFARFRSLFGTLGRMTGRTAPKAGAGETVADQAPEAAAAPGGAPQPKTPAEAFRKRLSTDSATAARSGWY